MIEIKNLTKGFGENIAVKDVSLTVQKGSMFGLVGSNGAGKSTLFRLLAGIYKPDGGSITYGGEPVWENTAVKEKIIFVSDDLYLPFSQSIRSMGKLYKAAYKSFDKERLDSLVSVLRLNPKATFNTFSKGMRRQAAIALALSVRPDYLLLDETFDGLDIVMRGFIKQVIYEDMAERGTTVLLSSHSLKELEDCADRIALLHRGEIVMDSDLADAAFSFFKVQVAFEGTYGESRFEGLKIRDYKQNGKVASFIAEGDRGDIEARLGEMNPLLLDVLPLSLEELFVCSLEAMGYAYGERETKI